MKCFHHNWQFILGGARKCLQCLGNTHPSPDPIKNHRSFRIILHFCEMFYLRAYIPANSYNIFLEGFRENIVAKSLIKSRRNPYGFITWITHCFNKSARSLSFLSLSLYIYIYCIYILLLIFQSQWSRFLCRLYKWAPSRWWFSMFLVLLLFW